MNTIDERVVEMRFDNGNFESNVKTSMSTLEKLKQSLKLTDASKGLESLSEAAEKCDISGLGRGIETVQAKFSALEVIGVTALANITNSAINTGKQLIASLTTDQITAGWNKYADKTSAVQTIMAATAKDFSDTGEQMEYVNSQLDKLNWFTDETSYNFLDMVSNIGKFTSNNIPLDKSVTAMEGISTWAAISGANVNEASRAMYNLAQAISVGSVKLMDWKSIENANMATTEFKETALETAAAMGTLQKQANGTYRTLEGNIVSSSDFNSNLTDGWFTSDVLLATLDKYGGFADKLYEVSEKTGLSATKLLEYIDEYQNGTMDLSRIASETDITAGELASMFSKLGDETNKLGLKSFKAAQEAKTFREAIDSVKDAVSTGWMNTFEYIFGDYEEAKKLWTDVANGLYDVFAASGEQRNKLFKEWKGKEFGGRDDLIRGVFDIFSALYAILVSVSDAMHSIFGEVTVDGLVAVSSGVKEFGENLKSLLWVKEKLTGSETVEVDIDVSTNIEELEQVLRNGSVGDDVKKLQERLMELGYDVGPMGVDGILGKRTEAALRQFQKDVGLVENGIYDSETHAKLFEKLGLGGHETTTKIQEVDEYTNEYSTTLDKLQRIAKGAFAVLDIGFQGFKFGLNILKSALGIFSPVGDGLLTIGAAFGDWLSGTDEWLKNSGKLTEWAQKFTNWLSPLKNEVGKATNAVLRFFGFGEEVDETNDKVVTFRKLWNQVKDGVKNTGIWDKMRSGGEKIKKTFGDLSPVFKEYYKNAKTYLGEKFSGFLEKAADKMPGFAEKVGDFFLRFVDYVSPMIEKIPGALAKLKSFFGGVFSSAWGFAKKTPKLLPKIGSFFTDIFKQLKESERARKIFDNAKSFLSGFGDGIREFFDTLSELIDRFTTEKDISGDTNAIEEKINPLTKISETLTSVWETFSSAIKRILTGAKDLLGEVDVGGILGVIATVIGGFYILKTIRSISGIAVGVKNVLDNTNKVLKTLKKGIKNGFKKDSSQALSRSILEIAGAVALLVGALWVLGTMDSKSLKQGAIALGSIVGAMAILIGLTAAFVKGDKAGAIASVGAGMKNLAIAIGILVGSIFLLGKMDVDTLKKGGTALAGIMGGILLFSMAFDKMSGKDLKLKGFTQLAIAIGLLTAIMWVIGHMSWSTIGKGLVGLLGVMALLGTFVIAVNRLGGSSQIKYSGLFGLSIAIGLLTAIMWAIGHMNWTTIGKGLVGLLGVMALLGTFVIAVNRLGGGKAVKMTGILALSIAIGILVVALMAIGSMPFDNILKGIVGLAGIMVALGVFMKMVGGVKAKAGLSALLSLIGVAAVMVAFSYALREIKDVDASRIIAFAEGLAMVMVGFGAFMALSSVAGFGGLAVALLGIIGLIGIIAGVIAAFGALSDETKHPGFQELMNRGAESIGEIIGTVIGTIQGATQAAQIKQLGKGLSNLSDIEIDQAALDNLLVSAQRIADFENNLPDKDTGKRWMDFITGSPLKNLSTDTAWFGVCFNIFASALSSINSTEGLEEKTGLAIRIGQAISDFGSDLPEDGLSQNLINWLFGSPLRQLSDDMVSFAEGFNGFVTEMKKIKSTKNLEKKTEIAIGIASSIKNFSKKLPESTIGEAIVSKIINSPIKSFSDDMVSFAEGFNGFVTEMKNIDTSLTQEEAEAAIGCAKSVASFFSELGGLDIEVDKNGISTFFTGDTNLNTVLTKIPEFGSSIKRAGESLAGISTGTFADDVTAAMTFLTGLVELFTFTTTEGTFFDATSLNLVAEKILTLGINIESFNDSISSIDTDRLSAISSLMNSIVQILLSGENFSTSAFSTVIEDALNTISESAESFIIAGSELASQFNSGIGGYTDMSGMAEVCDACLAVSDSYQNSFENAGYNMGIGLANGLDRSSAIAVSVSRAVALAMLSSAKYALGINSPSKEYEALGMYSDLGFANGLDRYASVVESSAGDVAKSALNSTGSVIANLASTITNGIDATPTIRPVLDLDEVTSGIEIVNGMFRAQHSLSAGISASVRLGRSSNGNPLEFTHSPNSANNHDVVDAINTLTDRFDNLSTAVSNIKMVLDTGEVVGALGPKMDKQLGMIAGRKERGN